MSTTMTATGRIRYRVHKPLFRAAVVVVQVEWRIKGTYHDQHGMGTDFNYLEWRDARIQDLTATDQPTARVKAAA